MSIQKILGLNGPLKIRAAFKVFAKKNEIAPHLDEIFQYYLIANNEKDLVLLLKYLLDNRLLLDHELKNYCDIHGKADIYIKATKEIDPVRVNKPLPNLNQSNFNSNQHQGHTK